MASSDEARALASFKSELDTLQREFLSVVDEITNSEDAKQVNASSDDALAEFRNLFAASALGSLENVQRDSGIPVESRSFYESSASLAAYGFLFANNRWFFCGTKNTPLRSPSSVGGTAYSGVGDGEYAATQLQELIPGYQEPDIEEVLRYQTSRKNTGYKQSVVGPAYDGNLSRLRELFLSSGNMKSTVAALNALIKSGYLMSTTEFDYNIVAKPNNVDANDFTVDYVKSISHLPLEDSRILKLDDGSYLTLLEKQSVNVDVCRLFRAESNESTLNYAPLFVSRGFDETKLSQSAYLLGIKVNGIARVIDVTGDRGSRMYASKYTAVNVADAIRAVFPDFVDCGVFGSEFYVMTKGSGGYCSIEFIPLDNLDASKALGIENTVRVMYDPTYVFDKPLAILGGNATSEQPSSGFIKYVASSELKAQQKSTILANQTSYWSNIEYDTETDVAKLVALFTKQMRSNVSSGVADLSVFAKPLSDVSRWIEFTFIDDMRPWEALDIISVLGSDVERVLKLVDITEIDIYTSEDQVLAEISSVLQSLQASGNVSNVAPKTRTTPVKAVNTTQVETAEVLRFAMIDYHESGNNIKALEYYDRFAQAANLGISLVSSTTVSDGSSVLAYDSLLDDILDVIALGGAPSTPEIDQAVADYVRRTYPDTYQSISGNEDGFDVSNLSDSTIWLLKKADALLASVQSTLKGYASRYQSAYNKLMALSNVGMNIYGNQGFQTKYLSCYVTGSASLALGKCLQKYLEKVNELANSANKILQKIISALREYFDKISCMVNNMKLSMSGYVSYSKVTTGAMGIQLNMNCVMSTGGFDTGLDPQIASLINSILGRVIACLTMFELQVVTFEKQDSNIQATSSQLQADLVQTLLDALNKLKGCLS